MTRLKLAAFIAALSVSDLALFVTPTLAETVQSHPAVLELFTSQGCSSCPPADKLVQSLSERPNVIALSLPVTYWDYLGWQDTLARPENTKRQRDYAAIRGDGQVYTPQMIVNGIAQCVGSDRAAVEAAIRSTAHRVANETVSIEAHLKDDRLIIDTGAAALASAYRSGKVLVASAARTASVHIARGENAGRQVSYTNVVRRLLEAGEWQGEAASYAVRLSSFAEGGDMFVVFLQADGLGPILGAMKIER